jgi:hypothetical protein
VASKRPLTKLLGLFDLYIVATPEQKLILALWVVHTYVVHEMEQTPYLVISSPEKRCGKSRLLELLARLVARPFGPKVMPSEAVVYRSIDAGMPTILLDEVDAIFNPKTANFHEGLRAILNSGHRKGNTVSRCAAFGNSLESFQVYSAKALAGIGVLPDTITDRSIPIRLQRKLKSESIARFRMREVEAATAPIREALERWASENGEAVREARPVLPDELNDRMQDGCEGLLAIADLLGYGDEARAALLTLLQSEREDTREDAQVRLLRDVRTLFTERDTQAILTSQLCAVLNLDGWGDWYGRGLAGRDVAALLSPYGIHSKSVRDGEATGKGYHHDDFVPAWSRYLDDDHEEEENRRSARTSSRASESPIPRP